MLCTAFVSGAQGSHAERVHKSVMPGFPGFLCWAFGAQTSGWFYMDPLGRKVGAGLISGVLSSPYKGDPRHLTLSQWENLQLY